MPLKTNKKEVEKMDKRIIPCQRVVYSERCPKCQKEIKGLTESHVVYNMKIHNLTQHPDNIENDKA